MMFEYSLINWFELEKTQIIDQRSYFQRILIRSKKFTHVYMIKRKIQT